MTPDQYARTSAPCRTCGQHAHAGMRFERVAAAVFNGLFTIVGWFTWPMGLFVRKHQD